MLILPRAGADWRIKPPQWGPLSAVQSSVKWQCDAMGLPVPVSCAPMWNPGDQWNCSGLGTYQNYGATYAKNRLSFTRADPDFLDCGTIPLDAQNGDWTLYAIAGTSTYPGLSTNVAICFDTTTSSVGIARRVSLGFRIQAAELQIDVKNDDLIIATDDIVNSAIAVPLTHIFAYKSGSNFGVGKNGAIENTSSLTCDDATWSDINNMSIGGLRDSDDIPYSALCLDGFIEACYVFNSTLTPDQIALLYEQPYRMLYPAQRPLIFDLGAGTTSLTASAGSYVVTGAAATTLAVRTISATAGSYSLTGVAATLSHAYVIVADAGALVVNGADATLTYIAANEITAEPGIYTLSGADATLLVDRAMTASPGAYTVTGQAATLLLQKVLSATAGAYTLSGADASLLVDHLMSASPGTYTLTGEDLTTLIERIFTAAAGSYAVTGADATLLQDRILTAATGAYAITGADVTVTVSSDEATGELTVTFSVKQPGVTYSTKQPGLSFIVKQPGTSFTH